MRTETPYRWRPRKEVRREEIAQLRQAGREAFLAGRHRQTCPHRFMNQLRWQEGYDDAAREAADNA